MNGDRFNFKKNEDGSTALEFALLAFPFMLLVIAIVELSIFFATTTVIEGALVDVTRLIRTGQLQAEPTLQEMEERFVQEICDHAGYITNCTEIEYEVRKLDSFGSDIAVAVTDDGSLDEPDFEIEEVTAGCVVMVRLLYGYKFMTPFFADLWSNYPDDKRLILSTTVVKTEPFDFEAADNCEIS